MELYRNTFLLAIPLTTSLLTGPVEALILRDSETYQDRFIENLCFFTPLLGLLEQFFMDSMQNNKKNC